MTKYITNEECLEAKGINLELELQDDDNHSNKVQRFIREITNWCIEYLVMHYDCNELLGNFDNLKEFRQKYFKEGVIEQIEYVLGNGWLNKDSGFNAELGAVVSLEKLELGRNAYKKFFLGAFCNIERY